MGSSYSMRVLVSLSLCLSVYPSTCLFTCSLPSLSPRQTSPVFIFPAASHSPALTRLLTNARRPSSSSALRENMFAVLTIYNININTTSVPWRDAMKITSHAGQRGWLP